MLSTNSTVGVEIYPRCNMQTQKRIKCRLLIRLRWKTLISQTRSGGIKFCKCRQHRSQRIIAISDRQLRGRSPHWNTRAAWREQIQIRMSSWLACANSCIYEPRISPQIFPRCTVNHVFRTLNTCASTRISFPLRFAHDPLRGPLSGYNLRRTGTDKYEEWKKFVVFPRSRRFLLSLYTDWKTEADPIGRQCPTVIRVN